MATSVVVAMEDLYNSLTPGLFPGGELPPIYFDRIPEVQNGLQLQPPYVTFTDLGDTPTYTFEHNPTERTQLAFDVYANTLGDVDQIVEAMKYNGGPVTSPLSGPDFGQGLDFGNLSTLTIPYSEILVKRTRETRRFAGRGAKGQRVHACRLEYQIDLQRS